MVGVLPLGVLHFTSFVVLTAHMVGVLPLGVLL